MTVSTPMMVTFCVYILGMVLIGFIAYRSTKNFDDYILGGRSLGAVVTALSAGASDMSGRPRILGTLQNLWVQVALLDERRIAL